MSTAMPNLGIHLLIWLVVIGIGYWALLGDHGDWDDWDQ